MKKLKLAVVGTGHLGRIHATLLAGMSDVELVAVADPSPTARERVAADCGAKAVSDHQQLLDNVDAAVIATPTQSHHAVALDFLRRGIHLLVEKPLASTSAQAAELVECAERHRATLQVGHIERFNPALTAAAGHLRDPKFIEATRISGFTFRSTDIGVVLDLMIHDLDVVLDLVRSPLRSVSALGLALVGRHEDVAHARLEFENGCIAHLSASRVSSSMRRQMQVWSSYALGTIDFAARTASIMRPSETLLRRALDLEQATAETAAHLKDHLLEEHLPVEHLRVETRNALADELHDFVESVRTGRAPRVDGQQGLAALRVADQILASIGHHAWDGTETGAVGPLATPPPPTLRGPHWDFAPHPTPRREAG